MTRQRMAGRAVVAGLAYCVAAGVLAGAAASLVLGALVMALLAL